jgi:hypothetical protein
MPAVSKAQQKFMAICEHDPQHAKGKCPSADVASEFSSTPTTNLPYHVKSKTKSLKSRML